MNIALINHLEEVNERHYSGIVQRAKNENLKDIIKTVKGCNLFDRIIIQTNNPEVIQNTGDIEIQNTSQIPDFGRRLNLILKRYPGCRLFYTGSGSSVFLTPKKTEKYLGYLRKNSIIANNLYSADYFFIRTDIKRPAIDNIRADNSVPKFLIERYGLYGIEIKRDEFSLFDIDGPLDLLALKISGKGKTHLRQFLEETVISNPNIMKMVNIFTRREKEILFWGRISEFLIQFLRYRTACRTKFVVEGRGLVSQGGKDFYSIFFDAFYRLGEKFLFKNLHRYCDALFIDSRILFSYLNMDVRKEDRFALDMLDINRIYNPEIKRLCRLAVSSKIPVVFCNHSFLNSGIPLLVDFIWRKSGYKSSKYGNGIVKAIIQ